MNSMNAVLAAAIISFVAAVPMVKRDIAWVTETNAVVVTVPVTTTVWVNPGESLPTASASTTSSHFGHHHSHSTSTVQSTVTVAAPSSSAAAPSSYETPTSSTSVYVAPTTTSTSEYVAPTTSTSEYVAPATTSEYVAPTTTSEYVAPTTSTSVWVAPTTSSSSAAAISTAGASTSSGSTYSGDMTHYDVGMGSCGWTNTDDEAVIALAHGMMTTAMANAGIANPNLNPYCGKMITISYGGTTHQAKIVDTCGGCDGASIDLSPTLFTAVDPTGDGRVHNVEWWFT